VVYSIERHQRGRFPDRCLLACGSDKPIWLALDIFDRRPHIQDVPSEFQEIRWNKRFADPTFMLERKQYPTAKLIRLCVVAWPHPCTPLQCKTSAQKLQ
jgi:hypothetical protein